MIESPTNQPGRVTIGALVSLRNEATAAVSTYRVVMPEDADLDRRRLSAESPVARAILGARVGDRVEVPVPDGFRTYRIEDLADE